MIIRWSSEAMADLIGILEHMADTDPVMADNLAHRIEQADKYIQLFPRAAYYDKTTDTYERYVARTRVILVYRILENVEEIVVIAAFHTSRNPSGKVAERR